jgi:hypothetical protein
MPDAKMALQLEGEGIQDKRAVADEERVSFGQRAPGTRVVGCGARCRPKSGALPLKKPPPMGMSTRSKASRPGHGWAGVKSALPQ